MSMRAMGKPRGTHEARDYHAAEGAVCASIRARALRTFSASLVHSVIDARTSPSTIHGVHLEGGAAPPPAEEAPAAVESAPEDALRALRELLSQGADRAALRGAAGQLGLTIRALEQRLSAAGTSFQNELRQARVKEAQRLLLSTVQSTTAIARQLGFPSLQHFTVEFRKLTGEAPGSWRARRS